MELKLFDFTSDTLTILKNIKKDLNSSADILDDFFFYLLDNTCEGFFNISTRVKSSSSLKEKIIRHNYYLKYNTPIELLENLSDLIGVRIECRFIEDEEHIFKFLKSVFVLTNSDGFSYSSQNSGIFLDLRNEQPLKQKNGFKLFRIDGYIINETKQFNFELQIKSMVNTFWGEIEHKVIYKNYNMLFGDSFYKNILNSIKSNLCLIDNQLLTIFNHINNRDANLLGQGMRKEGIELLLSKMIFDIYSFKVNHELGVSIDFRNACDIIIDYILSKNNSNTPQDYYKTFINTSIRLNEIFKNPISFKSKLYLGSYLDFSTEFSKIIGEKLADVMNKDFHWNLFFKILFEIEPGNNLEDFECFIKYLETIFYNREGYLNLYLKFSPEETKIIKDDVINIVISSFLTVDSIKFIYRDKLSEIFHVIDDYINFIIENNEDFKNYDINRYVYLQYLLLNILAIFNIEVYFDSLYEFIEQLKTCKSNIIITTKGIEYIKTLECSDKVLVNKLLEYIYIR